MLRNITLSAEETLIAEARRRARAEKRTLNAVFREWLSRYARPENLSDEYAALMQDLDYAAPGRRFSREELNER